MGTKSTYSPLTVAKEAYDPHSDVAEGFLSAWDPNSMPNHDLPYGRKGCCHGTAAKLQLNPVWSTYCPECHLQDVQDSISPSLPAH